MFPQGLLVIGRSQRVNLALPGHPTPWLLNETRAGFHEGTVAILRDPYSRAGPEAVIGVPGAMGPSPAVSTSYMAGQRRVDKVIIPGYITSGRSTYQSPRRSSGRSIAAGSTCQVSHAPHSGTLHAGLPGTRAPACCLESFITRIFLPYPATFFILTKRQRNPRSVFPCSVTFPDAGTLGPGRPGFGETVGNTTSHGLAAPRRVLEHVGRTSSSSSPGMYPSLSGLLRECFLDERRFPTFEVLAGKHRVVP